MAQGLVRLATREARDGLGEGLVPGGQQRLSHAHGLGLDPAVGVGEGLDEEGRAQLPKAL